MAAKVEILRKQESTKSSSSSSKFYNGRHLIGPKEE